MYPLSDAYVNLLPARYFAVRTRPLRDLDAYCTDTADASATAMQIWHVAHRRLSDKDPDNDIPTESSFRLPVLQIYHQRKRMRGALVHGYTIGCSPTVPGRLDKDLNEWRG
jgi:hypothetical protein